MRTQQAVIDKINKEATKALLEQENGDLGALVRHYRQAQKDIINELNNVFDEMADSEEGWQLDYMERTGRTKKLLDQINHRLSLLMNDTKATIRDSAVTQYQGATYHTAYMMDQATPDTIAISFPVLPVPAIQALVNTPFKGAMFSQRIGVVTDAMASDIRDQLLQSMIAGDSMRDAAKRIKNVFGADDFENPSGYTNRALTIARTEIMRAQNLGRNVLYNDNKDIMAGTVWLATPDRRICKWCLRRDGKTAAQIKAAPSQGDPWKKTAQPPLHPRCRCVLLPKLKTWRQMGIDMPEEMDDDVRGMRVGTKWVTAPVQNFENWKAVKGQAMGIQL